MILSLGDHVGLFFFHLVCVPKSVSEEVAVVSWRQEWLLNALIPEPILVSDSGRILWHLSFWRHHILDRKQDTGSIYCGS